MYDEIISEPVKIVNDSGTMKGYTSVYVENRKPTKSKRGWTKMYRLGYDEIAREMTSSLEYDIFTMIRDSNEPKTFILKYTQKEIVQLLGTTRNTVAKTVKKLKDLDFIRKEGSIIIMNPFVYVPPRMDDKIISEAQNRWKSKKTSR